MNIAFILPGRNHSGGVRVTVVQANYLMDRGHTVRIYYRDGGGPLPYIKSLLKGEIFREKRDWVDQFQGEAIGYKSVLDCDFEKDEILVGVGMWASWQLGRLSRMDNPRVQYIHGATPWDPNLMERALSLPIPKIVVANYLKPIVERYNGRLLDVIPNGIEPREYFQSVGDDAKNGVGTIFSPHPAKDPATILGVIEKLRVARPDIPIRIFGGGKQPRIPEGVSYKMLPSVAEAREIYSRSKVWFIGSKSEGFSLPVLEAMACGCAVVSTDCGGVRDILENERNGFIAGVGDIQGLTERILFLLDNNIIFDNMRINASETVKEFNWDKSIDKIEQAFISI